MSVEHERQKAKRPNKPRSKIMNMPPTEASRRGWERTFGKKHKQKAEKSNG